MLFCMALDEEGYWSEEDGDAFCCCFKSLNGLQPQVGFFLGSVTLLLL